MWNNTSAVHQLVRICIRWYIYVFASIIRGLLSRVQIVSGFMKDAQLGLKRLASMPDRTTNTISTEEGLPCTHSCVFVSAVTGLHMKISISTSVYMHPYAHIWNIYATDSYRRKCTTIYTARAHTYAHEHVRISVHWLSRWY